MRIMQNHLHIWDFEKKPSKIDKELILWRIYDDDITSIPDLIEKNSDTLKAQYLEWVFDVGASLVNGKNLIDKLKIRDNFSFWWMTLISEKCNYSASPQITKAISLMAFDAWMSNQKVNSLEFNNTVMYLFEYWLTIFIPYKFLLKAYFFDETTALSIGETLLK